MTQIYRNDDGVFTNINAGWLSRRGTAAWGDYDNDGDLDILLTGWTLSSGLCVYRNIGGTFSDVTAGLTDIRVSAAAWGDYDGDGDLDILLSGNDSSGPVTQVYRNDGTVTDINAGLIGADFGDVAWGDYDNDGDLDILLTGSNGSGRVAQIYRNDHLCTLNVTQSGTGSGSVPRPQPKQLRLWHGHHPDGHAVARFNLRGLDG
ncbi:MAG: FG-GAP-like repeat-containing protein [Caldilineaceae bacterium]